MKRFLWFLGLLLAGTALGQDFRAAPQDSALAQSASRFVENKRWGAALLWGGLLLASLIIGYVRARGRRSRP